MFVLVVLSTFSLAAHYTADDSAPLVMHHAEILTPVVKAGSVLKYHSKDYSKRRDCYPPQGEGKFFHLFASVEGANADEVVHKKQATMKVAAWPPGKHLNHDGFAEVPASLPPGRYSVSFVADYSCHHASKILRVSQMIGVVTVIAK